jgi:hypothetical protein
MHKAIHTALPATLDLRLVKVHSTSPGFRTQGLQIITTLQDTHAHSAAQIELCFDDIKMSLHMHAFRCKSPHIVARELLMHMIAHNLARQLIACAEPMRELEAEGTLSFKGTMDRLDQWQWVVWRAPSGRQARMRRDSLLQSIANNEVPPRPGRKVPRVCKDRQNKYTFMTKPRHLYTLQDDLAHAS